MCNCGRYPVELLFGADCKDLEYLILMFLFRELPNLAEVAVSSSKDVGTVVSCMSMSADRSTNHCRKGIASRKHRPVYTAILERPRDGYANTGTKPARRIEPDALQRVLSPP
jgi:hypothetical protein